MQLGYRWLLLGYISLALLSGCHFDSFEDRNEGTGAATTTGTSTGTQSGGTGTVPFSGSSPLTGTDDLVIATSSATLVSGVVGSSQTIGIAFTSSDGLPMSGFSISSGIGALPTGWSGPENFSCASVISGSGCVLDLTYAPVDVGSGTLTVDYVVVDNSGTPRTSGSVAIVYTATAYDNVLAAVSPTGQVAAVVGGTQSVSVNFTTDDGNAATHLTLTTNLGALPSGWTATQPGLSCAIVSTGSGCQLVLTFTPKAPSGGMLTLNYGYRDDSGAAKTGNVIIPYAATSSNNVTATASPAGEIVAVQKTGGQPVAVTFTTDDGKPASGLSLTSNLKNLPAGWTSTSASFSCGSVSAGNGCQLPLTYAPTALANGTLTLSYAYTDGGGMAKTGSLNIAYAATTNDNVVGTASPAGQVTAVIGDGSQAGNGGQAIAITFTTDDGRPATALQLTTGLTALSTGWSSTVGGLACSGLNADNVCQLPLTYSPTVAGGGTLMLNYSYLNNAGEAKTGSVNVAYRATVNDSVVGTPSQSSLSGVRTGSSTPVDVTFTTDDGNPASALSVSSGLATLPAGWTSTSNSFSCTTVDTGTGCQLPLTYAPTVAATAAALTLGFTYTNDAGFVKTGSVTINYSAYTPYLYVTDSGSPAAVSACPVNFDNGLAACSIAGAGFSGPTGIALNGSSAYVTNAQGTSVSRCTLDSGGALSSCAATGGAFSAPTYITTNPAGTFAYIYQSTGLSLCAIAAGDGSLSGSCVAADPSFDPLYGVTLSADGTHAYGVHSSTSGSPAATSYMIDVCNVAPTTGILVNCLPSAAAVPQATATAALYGNNLYVLSSAGSLYLCPVNTDASLSACQTTALSTNANGLAFIGTTAYLSTHSTTVLACPVNTDGTLGNCTTLVDPTFSGTAGMVVR